MMNVRDDTTHAGHIILLYVQSRCGQFYVTNTSFLDVRQVVFSAHTFVLHSGQVLHLAAPHQHDVMLLETVAFSGDVGRHLAPATQSHPHALSIGRVWFLWFLDERLEDHALHERLSVHGARTHDVPFGRSAAVHLLQSRHLAAARQAGHRRREGLGQQAGD